LVDGIDVGERPEEIRPRVALLPHATGLYDDLTAAENLTFAAALMRVPAPDRPGRVADALDRVGLAAERDARVGSFSAGMRRRLALGRILLGRPRLVLLDEPYAALDAAGMAFVDDLLAEWRANGATLLVATHAAERLEPRIDGWMRLEHGLLAEVGGTGVSGRIVAPATGPAPAPGAMPAGAGP
jgi:ABC-type multidrug transport system ATPase subunit